MPSKSTKCPASPIPSLTADDSWKHHPANHGNAPRKMEAPIATPKQVAKARKKTAKPSVESTPIYFRVASKIMLEIITSNSATMFRELNWEGAGVSGIFSIAEVSEIIEGTIVKGIVVHDQKNGRGSISVIREFYISVGRPFSSF